MGPATIPTIVYLRMSLGYHRWNGISKGTQAIPPLNEQAFRENEVMVFFVGCLM